MAEAQPRRDEGNVLRVESGLPKDLNDIVENTSVFIAEGEILEQARDIVAEEYSRFMLPELRDKDVVFEDLCLDQESLESEIFVVNYSNPENGDQTVLGTLRVVFGDENREPPLEAMGLIEIFDKNTGKSAWPHEEAGGDLLINNVCELGRLVMTDEVKKDSELQFHALSSLMKGIFSHAKSLNAEMMIAIMPTYVYEFAKRNGINLEKLNSEKELFYKDSPKAIEIREKYPAYWSKLKPSLYVIDMDSYE